jgi:phytoene dehydrogenase-like protein
MSRCAVGFARWWTGARRSGSLPVPDAVVIGAGPNGLVAANHLADAGWSVVVLETASEPGGAVRTGELTLPGFRHDLFSAFYPLGLASPAIAELGLEQYGLRWCHAPLALAHPLLDGRCAFLSTELEETARSLEAFSAGDGDAWKKMIAEWDKIEEPFLGLLFRPFPPIRSALVLLARLGVLGTLRFIRHALLPVRRMSDEHFGGEGAGLLLAGSAMHTDLSPEAAGSGLYGWLLGCLGQKVGFPVPEGGAGALTDALVRRLQAKGGKVECDCRVDEVIITGGRAVGVRIAGGATIAAKRAVVADVSAPALYGDLVDRRHVSAALIADLENFQWDMATVKVDWALSGPVPWTAPDARRAGTVHIADDFNNLTECSAHIAMRQLPSRPFIIFGQQSVSDPSRSPAGTDTAWGYCHVPREILGDAAGVIAEDEFMEPAKEAWLAAFVDRMEARIEALAPGFGALVLGRHVFSPSGLHRRDDNLDGGAIGGGTSQPHQQLVLRPFPGAGRPETPIAGLYLASSSAHPGGGVHGVGGSNAAAAALLPFRRGRAIAFGRGKLRPTG